MQNTVVIRNHKLSGSLLSNSRRPQHDVSHNYPTSDFLHGDEIQSPTNCNLEKHAGVCLLECVINDYITCVLSGLGAPRFVVSSLFKELKKHIQQDKKQRFPSEAK